MFAASTKSSKLVAPEANPLLESLIKSVIKDEKGAFDKLHAELNRYVLNVAYKYCHSLPGAAEIIKDVSQEVWQKVYAKRATIDNPAGFKTWLYATTRNAALNLVKKEALRRSTYSIDGDGRIAVGNDVFRELAVPAEAIPYLDLKDINKKRIAAALEKLSPNHREVLTLAYLENRSGSEISEMLGVNACTVRSRIHYALADLRKYLLKSNS